MKILEWEMLFYSLISFFLSYCCEWFSLNMSYFMTVQNPKTCCLSLATSYNLLINGMNLNLILTPFIFSFMWFFCSIFTSLRMFYNLFEILFILKQGKKQYHRETNKSSCFVYVEIIVGKKVHILALGNKEFW